ncbi:glutathione transferase [Mycena polygramma]|nr:glutathione transferase [Mycena polygramma]
MVLKLHATKTAAGGGGIVAMVLAEKQIPYELVMVDMAGDEHKTPNFLAMHPFGQVPVMIGLTYGRRTMRDSPSPKAAPSAGLQERARVEAAASFEFANFYPVARKLAVEVIGKPRRGLPVDQTIVAEGVAELSAKLDVYEVILGKQKFLAGGEFTLADIFHLTFAPLFAGTEADIMTKESRPNVARWWNDIISRPTWVNLKAEGIKSTAT